jgi:hypothetical protein
MSTKYRRTLGSNPRLLQKLHLQFGNTPDTALSIKKGTFKDLKIMTKINFLELLFIHAQCPAFVEDLFTYSAYNTCKGA